MTKYLLLSLASMCIMERIVAQCGPPTASLDLDVNNVRARINNGGDMWWDLIGSAMYEVPAGSGKHPLFAGALWIGGLDQNNQLHIAAQTYRQNGNDYFSGPLDGNGNVTGNICQSFDQMWPVYGSEIDNVIAAWNAGGGSQLSASVVPQNVLQWPAINNPYNTITAGRNLAPFYDRDGDGHYDPTYGDYPVLSTCGTAVYADQMVWWVFNDKGNAHTESNGLMLGIEVQALAYAFQTIDALNDQTFYRFKIINRSPNVYNDVYAGLWVDPDLCYLDGFIGCDTAINTAIIYDGKPADSCWNSSYGIQSPFIGIKVLNTFSNDATQRPLSSFMFYNNDFTPAGNPESPDDYYGYLKATFKDGTHLTQSFGGTLPTNFVFPSDPTDSLGWSYCTSGNQSVDRRIILGSGPVTLQPGQARTLDYAVVFVQPQIGSYSGCPSFDIIQSAALLSQQWYDATMCVDNSVGVTDLSRQPFAVYPNPVAAGSKIFLDTKEIGKVEIIDVLGRSVASQSVTIGEGIEINPVFTGYYVLRFINDQGVSFYAKLVVQ